MNKNDNWIHTVKTNELNNEYLFPPNQIYSQKLNGQAQPHHMLVQYLWGNGFTKMEPPHPFFPPQKNNMLVLNTEEAEKTLPT